MSTSERMEAGDYLAARDRKYNIARAMSARDMKEEYIRKVARRKPRRPKGD